MDMVEPEDEAMGCETWTLNSLHYFVPGPLGPLTDPGAFAANSVPLLPKATDPMMGTPASTAGARDEWLAIHEAAHAIVVIKAGIALRGVRFYGNGFPGETGFEETGWQESTDEDLLQSLIRISVAANIAELMHGHEPEGGYPSWFFDDRDPAERCICPSDVIGAWEGAKRLATVRFEKVGKEATLVELRPAKRAIIERAEAGEIVRENMGTLGRLAQELRRGPMSGAAVREIVGA